MANTKVIGSLTGADPTIGGTAFQCSKFTAKWDQEKIEYKALGQAWIHTIPNGVKKVSGSFEMAADTTTLGGTYPKPFDVAYVSFSVPCGSAAAGFSAVVTDVEIELTTELCTIKGNYQSDGEVTFS